MCMQICTISIPGGPAASSAQEQSQLLGTIQVCLASEPSFVLCMYTSHLHKNLLCPSNPCCPPDCRFIDDNTFLPAIVEFVTMVLNHASDSFNTSKKVVTQLSHKPYTLIKLLCAASSRKCIAYSCSAFAAQQGCKVKFWDADCLCCCSWCWFCYLCMAWAS